MRAVQLLVLRASLFALASLTFSSLFLSWISRKWPVSLSVSLVLCISDPVWCGRAMIQSDVIIGLLLSFSSAADMMIRCTHLSYLQIVHPVQVVVFWMAAKATSAPWTSAVVQRGLLWNESVNMWRDNSTEQSWTNKTRHSRSCPSVWKVAGGIKTFPLFETSLAVLHLDTRRQREGREISPKKVLKTHTHSWNTRHEGLSGTQARQPTAWFIWNPFHCLPRCTGSKCSARPRKLSTGIWTEAPPPQRSVF